MRFPRAANYTVPDRIIDHFKMNWEYVSCFHHANFEDNDLLKKHTPGVDLSYQISFLKRRGSSSAQTSSSHTFTFNFTSPINAVKVMWSNSGSSDSRRLSTFRVQYSDDGTDWTTAFEKTNMTLADKATEKIDDLITDGKAHKYWKVFQTSNTDNHITVHWLDFVVKA